MKFIYPMLLFLVVNASVAFGQDLCQSNVDFSIKEVTKGNFEIMLQSSSTLSKAQVKLYDLYTGKVVQERSLADGRLSGQSIFKNVKPSRYTILIKFDGCDKGISLGGIEGIKVGEI